VETVSVDFCGYNKTLPALRIKNTGTWIKAVFSDIKSAAELDAFVEESGGFTVEAFYMDNSSTGANRAIVCCTESIGGDARRSGWGIAENTDGKPYFITGHTSENAYSSVYANAAPAEEAIHVVAVYNAETLRNAIYINGELVSSDNAAGKFTAADKTEVYEGFNMGNVFYIGADPSASAGRKEHCDFPSSDLTVIDVKLYSKALTSGEVKAAYNSALELFL
jgi:hypothetical protein